MARDARVTRIFEGANEVLLLHAATAAVLRDGDDPVAALCASLPDSAPGVDVLRRTRGDLDDYASALRRRFNVRVVEEQQLLWSLGRAQAATFAAAAASLRASTRGAADADRLLAGHAVAVLCGQARAETRRDDREMAAEVSEAIYERMDS